MDKFPPRVGEVILRPIELVPQPGKGMLSYKKVLGTLTPAMSTNSETMVWARRNPDVDNLWVAMDDGKGLVCFLDGELVEDYTHFVITKVGRYGKNVHATSKRWEKDEYFDLFTTPNEERNAHEMLVQRVMSVLANKPDLLPLKTLAKRMGVQQMTDLCTQWFDVNRPDQTKEARHAALSRLRDIFTAADA